MQHHKEKEPAPFYRVLLQNELSERCARHKTYSLRAFAKHLGMDPGAFSRVLSGKRPLSPRAAKRFSEKLELSSEESGRFMGSLLEERKQHLLPGTVDFSSDSQWETAGIDLEGFRAISELYHYALLELTFVEGFSSDPKWIAKSLGISEIEARLAIHRLLEMKLLKRVNGSLKKVNVHHTTKEKSKTTLAHRRHQRQILSSAVNALDTVPIEDRNMTGITMAIDPKKLPEAKRRLQEFSRNLCEFLESGKRKRVYQLSLALFPLQTEEKKHD